MSADIAHTKLRKNAVGIPQIVFFVIAAAAPLTSTVGVSPAAFAFGNGAGVPGTYLLVGIIYLLFSVGFTAMSCHVGGAGGFYPYITAGLGRPFGVAGVSVALVTYNALEVAVFCLFGYFANAIVTSHGGPDVAWWIYAIGLAIIVYFFGRRNLEFSGKVLGVFMIVEIAILLVLSVTILLKSGTHADAGAIGLGAYGAGSIFTKGFGVSLIFVVMSFIGFEATVIFGEEARNPERSIPAATYIAVTLIAVFYAFVTWCITIYYGPLNIVKVSTAHSATMYFDAMSQLLGPTANIVMSTLLVTSIFAAALSFHNTTNRYFYAIGRERLAWSGFARTHVEHHSPHVAGAVQTVFGLAVIAAAAIAKLDPYAVLFSWLGTLASLGILVMQLLVSGAVIAYFYRTRSTINLWQRFVAPFGSILGLGGSFLLMSSHLALISGSKSAIIRSFPEMLILVGVAGFLFALHLRSNKPDIYANLGQVFED